MALTLVATPGAHTANTYATLAEANAILEGYANTTAWIAATDPQKNAALVQATREIDRLRLAGEKYYSVYPEGHASYQPLQFPKTTDIYNGALFIPERVKAATALQAAFIVRNGSALQATADLAASGIRSHSAGKFSQTLEPGGMSFLCLEAQGYLAPWIVRTIRIERG